MCFLYFYLSMGHFEITVVANSSDLRNYHIKQKHIVSVKLVGLTPVLRPLFPYEFEIPASPSMYPGSGGNSRTGSPRVVLFVGFLGRIRFTPESLTNGWYTIIPKDKVKAESLLITEHSSHTSMCINNASLFLAYQSINWWQNSVHILLILNDDSLFITYINYIASDNLWYLK